MKPLLLDFDAEQHVAVDLRPGELPAEPIDGPRAVLAAALLRVEATRRAQAAGQVPLATFNNFA